MPNVNGVRTDSGCALVTRLALLAGDEALVEIFQAGVGEHRQRILVPLAGYSSQPHSSTDAAAKEP